MIKLVSLGLFAILVACGPSEAEQAEACAKGVPRSAGDLEAGQCGFLTNERCFNDSATACVCAGCSSHCPMNESSPAVPACD